MIRIIGGQFRGRKIPVPPTARPTPDRVRETLFNWLSASVEGARCLDLFAGSGALGLEALSRGARWVTFCDKTRAVALHLQAQTERLSIVDVCDISCGDAERFLKIPVTEPYDIVFCDPPFRQDWGPKLLALLPAHMASQGLLYLETEADTLLDIPPDWVVLKEKTAGQVRYQLLMRQAL